MESIISITMISLVHNPTAFSAYNQLTQRQQQIKQMMNSTTDLSLIREYTALLEEKIKLETEHVMKERPSVGRGRGGNNIAQNIKKSLLSVLKKKLPRDQYADLQKDCILRHGLKSQKENILIFFLYLYKFHLEGRISHDLIEDIQEMLRVKIGKYINNSMEKMELEEERKEFHSKNIREFERFLQIDVNFRERKTFSEVTQQMRGFYIRKQIEFSKAVQRLAKVVQSEPILKSFFTDMEPPQVQPPVKEEQTSDSSPSPLPTPPIQ